MTPSRSPIPAARTDNGLSAAVEAIWSRRRADVVARVEVLGGAVAALHADELEEAQRESAEREAHKLAGSLGTFGFARGSELAREIEQVFGVPSGPEESDAPRLSEAVRALERELSKPAGGASVTEPEALDGGWRLLVVGHGEQLAQRLREEGAARGMSVEAVASPSAARRAVAAAPPDAVLLDLDFQRASGEALALLTELRAGEPAVPVLVLSVSDTFEDRVEVARRGGGAFLPKSLPPPQVVDAVIETLEAERATAATVLVVDDDPLILSMLEAMLEPQRMTVVTLDDPRRFWETLARACPDVVVLDFDMPSVGGLELCRVIRGDRRYAELPILFLTARRDTASVNAIFEAGADDYVSKPLVGPELTTRVKNRLERVALNRKLRVRQQEMEKQIQLAAGIQRGLLPGDPPQVRGVALAGRCFPAANVGGDCFDYLVDAEGRLVMFIADVAGHSIGSALLMAMARSTLRREIASGASPAGVLAATNRAMYGDLVNAEMFITMLCVRYDPIARTLAYANAGHNPALLQSRAGVVELDADGVSIGILDDVDFEQRQLRMEAGDRLLLYTDGVVEALDRAGGQFGEQRLSALLEHERDTPPASLVERGYAAVRAHTGSAPQQDDITLVALQAVGR